MGASCIERRNPNIFRENFVTPDGFDLGPSLELKTALIKAQEVVSRLPLVGSGVEA
jgi:hypothetical protein